MAATEIETLRQRLRTGDPEAYRTLVHELSEPLFRYARPQLLDDDLAQDVVQQTFIRLHRHRGRLAREGSLRGYCFFIATNLVRDCLRRQATRRRHEARAATMSEQATGDSTVSMLGREAFAAANQLPDDLRQVVLLRFAQGLTAAEAGRALGIPEGTVKTRQRTALERLRERLALGMAPALGLPELEQGISEGATRSVHVPTSLAANVEAFVMASVGTHSGISAAILIAVLVLLLGGGTAAGVAYMQSSGNGPLREPLAANARGANSEARAPGETRLPDPAIQNAPAEDSPVTPVEPRREPRDTTGLQALKLRGRVVDPDGKGVSGAWVCQARRRMGRESAQVDLEERFNGWGSVPATDRPWRPHNDPDRDHPFEPALKGAETDSQGWFSFDGLVPAGQETLQTYFTAWALGYSDGWQRLDLAEATDGVLQVTITIAPLERFIVFRTEPVVEQAIEVRLFFGDANSGSMVGTDAHPGRDGTHQLELDADDRPALLSLHAGGYAPIEVTLKHSRERMTDLGTIRLTPGRVVAGVVVDASGNPVEGAVIHLHDPHDADSFFASFGREPMSKFRASAADGSFQFNVEQAGAYQLTARHPDLAAASLDADVSAGDATGLRILMHAGAPVEGYVRFIGGALPVAHQVIKVVLLTAEEARRAAEAEYFSLESVEGLNPDDSMAFRFQRVAPGAYVLQATIAGTGRTSPPVSIVVDSLPVQADLAFGGRATLSGHITGTGAAPLVGAAIHLWRQKSGDAADGWTGGRSGVTDSDGRYLFEDLEPGRYAVLLPQQDNMRVVPNDRVVDVAERGVTLDIDLSARPPENRITGRFTRAGGGRVTRVSAFGLGVDEGRDYYASPDEHGAFELKGMPPGEFYVYAEAFVDIRREPDSGGKMQTGVIEFRQKVVFSDWGQAHEIEHHFETGTLRVSLKVPGGEAPAANVWLRPRLEYPHGREPMLHNEIGYFEGDALPGEGSLTFSGLAQGEYELFARADGYALATQLVQVKGTGAVTLELSATCGEAGVTFAGTLPSVGETCLYCVSEDVPTMPVMFFLSLESATPFKIPQLPPGRYTLLLRGAGCVTQAVRLDVEAGKTSNVEVPIVRSARITLVVKGEAVSTDAVQAARVSIRDAGSGQRVEAAIGVRGTDGRSHGIGALPAGTYLVELHAWGFEPEAIRVEVRTPDEVTLRFTPKRK